MSWFSGKSSIVAPAQKVSAAYPLFQTLHPEEEKIVHTFSKALGNEKKVFFIKESDAKYSKTTIENAFAAGIRIAIQCDDIKLYELFLGAGSSIGSILPDQKAERLDELARKALREDYNEVIAKEFGECPELRDANNFAIHFIEKYKKS